MSPALSSICIANLNQRGMAKQLLTRLRLIARMSFSLKNYSCELLNLTGTVGKVELISAFTTAVCESWIVSDKYTWDNAGDLKKQSMDHILSEDNRSGLRARFFTWQCMLFKILISHKRFLQSTPEEL